MPLQWAREKMAVFASIKSAQAVAESAGDSDDEGATGRQLSNEEARALGLVDTASQEEEEDAGVRSTMPMGFVPHALAAVPSPPPPPPPPPPPKPRLSGIPAPLPRKTGGREQNARDWRVFIEFWEAQAGGEFDAL
eukprot:TRINITY_DN7009_c0_g1_i1.p3 TRINITY_DN7009_c0_g1~~TRINITY_DN7009_c0_g1_i1.p3  ORF type:complete len:136 (+),score=42.62 TRINITY_DN7009_c0_g1_i1:548-955(+)